MKCRKCGHENVDSDWVCSRCEYVLDASFLGNDILNERTRDGIDDKRPSSQRIYTYRELSELLRAAGLEPVAAFGSLTGEEFKLGAQRLLLVAEKTNN